MQAGERGPGGEIVAAEFAAHLAVLVEIEVQLVAGGEPRALAVVNRDDVELPPGREEGVAPGLHERDVVTLLVLEVQLHLALRMGPLRRQREISAENPLHFLLEVRQVQPVGTTERSARSGPGRRRGRRHGGSGTGGQFLTQREPGGRHLGLQAERRTSVVTRGGTVAVQRDPRTCLGRQVHFLAAKPGPPKLPDAFRQQPARAGRTLLRGERGRREVPRGAVTVHPAAACGEAEERRQCGGRDESQSSGHLHTCRDA